LDFNQLMAEVKMNQSIFPHPWDEKLVKGIISYYDEQAEDEAAAQDKMTFAEQTRTAIEIPKELAHQGSRTAYEAVLGKVPDVEPDPPYEQLPPV
jgi:hypothetical protein